MMNIEIKTELRDLPLARTLAQALKAIRAGDLAQTDTYYKLADGRLKKRETVGSATEYVFYHRENQAKVRASHFRIYTAEQAFAMYGHVELPIWVVVKKVREVYLYENVRIHLDKVDDLGNFFELEALVSAHHDEASCHAIVNQLRTHFAPVLGEPISVGYSDLLAADKPD